MGYYSADQVVNEIFLVVCHQFARGDSVAQVHDYVATNYGFTSEGAWKALESASETYCPGESARVSRAASH